MEFLEFVMLFIAVLLILFCLHRCGGDYRLQRLPGLVVHRRASVLGSGLSGALLL